ncbi:MAG TPA: alanyl-tRNA editing protein [Actinomycetes bacterium]|jgi:misacylated tRNA(Ala) deacylase|nr:alanyl-tRNA editing protein [Actinomycetes bacterium]
MTDPLYQRDAYLAAFDAHVTATHPDGVVLDRSAFFPGGGGQPADQGTLSHDGTGVRVTGAQRREDAVVLLVDGPPPPAGTAVRGALDWERRYALMRTHTALHVLAGVIGRDHGALVTGGNMEPLKARMDFELAAMSAGFAEEVERALLREVEVDRPVHVSFLSPEEFLARPELIRTKSNLVPSGLGVVRVIDIEGLDRQADGGTHVARTAEVGTVRVVGHESKGKGNKRLRIALDPAPAPAPR